MMKTYSRIMVMGLLAAVLLTSCDEHEEIDRNIRVGDVLCDDHSTYRLEDYLQQEHKTAVGVVFAEATNERPALAVLLEPAPLLAFCDTLGIDCKTSYDTSAFDGYKNSVAMFSTGFSPLATYVFSSHQYGQSDYVPSYAECRLLYQALPDVNRVIGRLMEAHPEHWEWEVVSQEAGDGSCWYWTSTEDVDDAGNRAWLCSMATGGFQQTPKTEEHACRVVVALHY